MNSNQQSPESSQVHPTGKSMSERFRFWGPGFLVAAAFIGPGTVATAIRAGGNYGFQLLWAVIFAGIATIVFQGMAVRLGLATGKGLAESLRDYFVERRWRQVMLGLVIAAIVFGNTAYQAGNLSGAAKGLEYFLPWFHPQIGLLACSGLAGYLIWTGTLRSLKIVLSSLVLVMSVTFVVAAIQSRPSFPELLSGCFSYEVFDISVVFALIGTTVVPYNLFLHSSSIAEQHGHLQAAADLPGKNEASGASSREASTTAQSAETSNQPAESANSAGWSTEFDEALAGTRLDTWVAVWIGAVVTGAIVVTAAGTSAVTFDEAADSLTGLIGSFGKVLFFVGLFAAGLTSAITAPLAAGYVYAGCFQHPSKADGPEVRRVAVTIVAVGYLVAAIFGSSPDQVIFIAQIANGVILPLIAVFLILVMNSRELLGPYRNGWMQNVLGGLVVALIVILGLFKLGSRLGLFS